MNRPHHPSGPQPFVVSTPETLARLLDAVAPHALLALDTESDGFFRFRAKLCVVQVGVPGTLAVVDTLSGLDLTPLWNVLRSPDKTCILHDAEGDVTYLARDHGVTLGLLFDTAAAARMLGLAQLGLAGLCQSLLNVTLDKTEQKSDWARRPLSSDQVRYAAEDVAHLHTLRDALAAQLEAKGRTTWATQTFDRVRTRVLHPAPPDPEAWRAIKGAMELSPAERGLLRAAHAWREGVAERMDLAPFRICGNDTLLFLARRNPQSASELSGIRGINPAVLRGPDAANLVTALKAAVPVEGLLFERHEESEDDRVADARFEALRALRSEKAKALGMDVSLLLPNASLKQLARLVPTTLDQLGATGLLLPWQLEVLGTPILAVLAQPVAPRSGRARR